MTRAIIHIFIVTLFLINGVFHTTPFIHLILFLGAVGVRHFHIQKQGRIKDCTSKVLDR